MTASFVPLFSLLSRRFDVFRRIGDTDVPLPVAVRSPTSSPSRLTSLQPFRALSKSRTFPSFPHNSPQVAHISPHSLSLSAPTTSTTLNTASPLNLLGAVLVQGAKRIPVERTEENEADELVTLFLAGEAAEGEATLAVRFEGRLDDGALLGTLVSALLVLNRP